MSPKVALITGGSSGIGLALATHLQSKSWSTAIGDLNPPPAGTLNTSQTLFVRTDVSSYDAQASLFKETFKWHERLDFCALNAGIDDRDDIFDSVNETVDDVPAKPDMKTFEVDLYAVYYGIKLAAHYMSHNPQTKGGNIVVTASAAGLYSASGIPQYCACKHALIGLVRSLAPRAKKRGIRINAICPAMVPTNLAPAGILENLPEEHVTPMSTILRAYDELMAADENGKGKNGETVEAAVQDLFYRKEPNSIGESQKWMGKDLGPLWGEVYQKRNVSFARENEERAKGRAEKL